MNLTEFEQHVFDVALGSSICDIPVLHRLTATSVNLRIQVLSGGFIEAFFNERTGTTAYTGVRDRQRAYGADNTGGWHVHPFADPTQHVLLPEAISFAEIVSFHVDDRELVVHLARQVLDPDPRSGRAQHLVLRVFVGRPKLVPHALHLDARLHTVHNSPGEQLVRPEEHRKVELGSPRACASMLPLHPPGPAP